MGKKYIFVEGPTDRHVLNKLIERFGLTSQFKISKNNSGRDDAILNFIKDYKNQLLSSYLLLDFDKYSLQDLRKEVKEVAKEENIQVDTSRVIGVGLRDDKILKEDWGITQFAIDDYVFKLLIDEDFFNNLVKRERRLKIDYNRFIRKLTEVKDLFEKNGIPITTTKRYIPVIQAITNLVFGPGSFYKRMIEVASDEILIKTFSPLFNAIGVSIRYSFMRHILYKNHLKQHIEI